MHPNAIKVRDADNPTVIWTLDLHNNTRSFTDPQTGRLVTMDLGQSDVHVDAALSNYAAGYKQWEGIADEVAPIVPTDKASNKYFTWDKDDVFQQVETLVVGPDSRVEEVSPSLSTSTYTTVSYGVGAAISTELQANADAPLNPALQAMRRCMNAILLGREVRVANLVTTSGNWSGGYTTTLGATAKWNAGSASNPIQDIMTAIENSITPVNAVAMSEQVWHDFFQNAAVQKFVASKIDAPPLGAVDAQAYTRIVQDKLQALLGLPPFKIGRMRKKTSGGYGYVWGNNVALLYSEPGVPADGQSINTAKTFRWTGADNGVTDGTTQGGFLVRRYYDPRRGARGSQVVVVTHNDTEVMTSVFAGGLIINAHQ